ncbi:MAG TPA: PAS domain S-box protein [Polyangiaceae bacterium]|nr:PAS domain S-box protein [Polyangiaceae bacterium]
MRSNNEEETLLRSVALQNATSILLARQRAEQELVQAKEALERKTQELAHFAAVVESSDDAIVSKTLDGLITTWNKGAERIFGYTAEEVIGKPITILFPPDRLSEEPSILARLRRGERIDHYETVRQRKDGSLLFVSLTVSPVKDSSGKIIGVSKIARDITAQKRAEEALRDEKRVLELLNKTGIVIASQLDLQNLVQSVTDAATELVGAQFGAFFYNTQDDEGDGLTLYTLSGAPREAFEKLGLPRPTSLFGPTFRGEGPIRCDDVLADPRYGKTSFHRGMPKGHLPVRSYLAVSVVSRSGEVLGGLFFGHSEPGIFTERSERILVSVAAQAGVAIDNARLYDDVKRAAKEREYLLDAERAARAEAERVSLMKDEFLATLSHELRTPLNAILGWSQILRSRRRQDQEVLEGLSVIERNARVQTQLIEDLLDMSRIISGKLRLDVQRVDVGDALKAAVASVRHSAEAKDIRLELSPGSVPGTVRGDPNRLQQCFWNLLSNAIKFTPKGGRIRASLKQAEDQIEVSVADSGQGIKPEFLPHVFERFRQADASTTRRHGGLGLGLSIVKHLVELHGGSVRAESLGEGQGATFSIELPVMAADVREPESPREELRKEGREAAPVLDLPSLAGITVLAVDDEPDARDLLLRVLEECGARVVVAASAAEGLEAVMRERPDMIVSDIGMPGEDGYEFIRKVRKLNPEEGGRTPAAALTAFARAEDRTRALRAGFQTHVAKPVEPTELTAVVASLATRRV